MDREDITNTHTLFSHTPQKKKEERKENFAICNFYGTLQILDFTHLWNVRHKTKKQKEKKVK